jgi:aryl-alcohol dehydrogenase-like predicted oxidoreductase
MRIGTEGLRAPELGLGLLSIGRTWGRGESRPPSESAAKQLLGRAVELGVRFFDTAPSYGLSESILGSFLQTLPDEQLASVVVATKMGEHWDASTNSPFVDFSYSALCRSIDRSLTILGRVDTLQLHKADLEVLRSPDFYRAAEYAQKSGIPHLGASVRDIDTAAFVIADPAFHSIQLPFNSLHPGLGPAIDLAFRSGKQVLINRPTAMGELLFSPEGEFRGEEAIAAAYAYILQREFAGVILTGTGSTNHLEQNLRAFRLAEAIRAV